MYKPIQHIRLISLTIRALTGIVLAVLAISCSPSLKLPSIEVTETHGTDRRLEYIEVAIEVTKGAKAGQDICIQEATGQTRIAGQFIKAEKDSSGRHFFHYIFPVTIRANERKLFNLQWQAGDRPIDRLLTTGTGPAIVVNNNFYEADLTANTSNANAPLAPGNLKSLKLLQFGDKLLKRSAINMHWNPSFQKNGSEDYFTSSHIHKPDSIWVTQGPYSTILFLSGTVFGHPDIRFSWRYQFFAGLPYFKYSSEILVTDSVELFLLRNDEMTMDSLFTHLTYHSFHENRITIPLYDGHSVHDLEQNPIKDDAKWLLFYHDSLKYGYGSLRIKYDNTNKNGGGSPLYQPHTKISEGVAGGRYWNRRLIHAHPTWALKGSRYYEENGYLIMDMRKQTVEQIVNEYGAAVWHPLRVKIKTN